MCVCMRGNMLHRQLIFDKRRIIANALETNIGLCDGSVEDWVSYKILFFCLEIQLGI